MIHIPVLENEVISIFDPKPGDHFVDGTLGHAGHTKKILSLDASVTGLDYDQSSLAKAQQQIPKELANRFTGYLDNFTNFNHYLKPNTKGVLFDLGTNISQILENNTGISFQDDNLDMRLDKTSNLTASQIINSYSENELVELFEFLVQEKMSQKIAREITNYRKSAPITSALQLSALIKNIYQKNNIYSQNHPATKVFLALRIVVNKELDNIKIALQNSLLQTQKLKYIFITFHSTEDRLVKLFIQKNKQLFLAFGEIKPSQAEISQNPLSRSAILRWYEK